MEAEDIVVLKFADAAIPEFKESRSKDWISFGSDNAYPDYLTYLYNKSAKHGAIINGKSKYIYGSGLKSKSDAELFSLNEMGETWNDINKKCIKDGELYGGYRLFIVKDKTGKWAYVYHIEYNKLRADKASGFWYKSDWSDRKEEAKYYKEFTKDSDKDICVYCFNEYRPGNGVYPLPEYIACNNYIETDIEISKFHLSSIRNGMMPSKLIQFFNGTPDPKKQKEIEKLWQRKFTGTDNAGRFILSFSENATNPVQISDLSASELDKQFDILNQTCQQEIFTGHQVVSPMLFGIKTEGQLGGATELKTAYDIFINTYAKPKQDDIEVNVNYISEVLGQAHDWYFEQLDPIGIIIPDALLEQAMTPDEVRIRLGLPVLDKPAAGDAQRILTALSSVSPLVATKILDNLTRNEIRSLAGAAAQDGGDTVPTVDGLAPATVNQETLDAEAPVVNEAIRSLTAKQHQQLMRIIRQYGKDQITRDAAAVLLRTGLGLSDEDINTILGVEQVFSDISEDDIIDMFDKSGVHKQDYFIVKQRKVKFESDEDAEADETHYMRQAYKAPRLSNSDQEILKAINKDPLVSVETIADLIDSTPEYVTSRIGTLMKVGIIEVETKGEEINRKLTQPISEITDLPPVKTQVSIKYSYEGPQDSRNRPFCARLMKLNRLYSRAEIESISSRLGYSVFDRRGGFWRHKDGEITPYCRHNFKSNVVILKK